MLKTTKKDLRNTTTKLQIEAERLLTQLFSAVEEADSQIDEYIDLEQGYMDNYSDRENYDGMDRAEGTINILNEYKQYLENTQGLLGQIADEIQFAADQSKEITG